MNRTNNIGFLIQHLAFILSRQNDQVLQERLGIGFSQFKILMVLQWHPHVQQKKIANALSQTEASISRQIKLLHDKGLLQTSTSPGNKREHITTLTTKGMRYTEEAMSILNSYHKPMFEQLNEKQMEILGEALVTMHDFACTPGQTECRQFIGNNQ